MLRMLEVMRCVQLQIAGGQPSSCLPQLFKCTNVFLFFFRSEETLEKENVAPPAPNLHDLPSLLKFSFS